jgi:hypothetical protein
MTAAILNQVIKSSLLELVSLFSIPSSALIFSIQDAAAMEEDVYWFLSSADKTALRLLSIWVLS